MTFSPRDTRDVSMLVAMKLEWYLNVERRQNEFDTRGHRKTTHKMQLLDCMYNVLEKTELDVHRSQNQSKGKKDTSNSKAKETSVASDDNRDSEDEKRAASSKDSSMKSEQSDQKINNRQIQPAVIQNSRRVVTNKEAERLTENANRIFCEHPLEKLQLIHRYRPHSCDIPPIVENGRVQNYTHHVGSALHAKTYVDFYMREGLQTGRREHSKRLQRLNSPKKGHRESESDSSTPLRSSSNISFNDTV